MLPANKWLASDTEPSSDPSSDDHQMHGGGAEPQDLLPPPQNLHQPTVEVSPLRRPSNVGGTAPERFELFLPLLPAPPDADSTGESSMILEKDLDPNLMPPIEERSFCLADLLPFSDDALTYAYPDQGFTSSAPSYSMANHAYSVSDASLSLLASYVLPTPVSEASASTSVHGDATSTTRDDPMTIFTNAGHASLPLSTPSYTLPSTTAAQVNTPATNVTSDATSTIVNPLIQDHFCYR
jgi:hypothetical protein